MSKLIGAAAIILDAEGSVLLVKHSYGKNNWDLPGGKAEENESAQETAKREVSEEVGLDVRIEDLTGIYYDPNYDMHHFVFLATRIDNRTPLPSSPEIVECGFFSRNELPRPISDFTCRRIEELYVIRATNSCFTRWGQDNGLNKKLLRIVGWKNGAGIRMDPKYEGQVYIGTKRDA